MSLFNNRIRTTLFTYISLQILRTLRAALHYAYTVHGNLQCYKETLPTSPTDMQYMLHTLSLFKLLRRKSCCCDV